MHLSAPALSAAPFVRTRPENQKPNQPVNANQHLLNKLLCCTVAALACLANNSLAISVSNTGIATITFDVQPAVTDFSSRTWSGGAADFLTAAAMDTAVKTNSASLFNVALTASTANPPAALNGPAQWSSTGFYIQTRPTGIAGTMILATLVNNSGASRNAVTVDYDFTVVAPVAEEIKGHLVYYSMTGQPNSWVQISSISNQASDNTAGTYHKNATLDLSATPWAIGASMYLLWADDNGSGTPDGAMQIDNFDISFPGVVVPLSITLTGPANGQHFGFGSAIPASVALSGSPTNVSYFVDGTLAVRRTATPFEPVNLPSQSLGSHTIYVTAKDTNGTFVTTVTNTFFVDNSLSGTLATNTTLYASNSPYGVSGNLTVPSGLTLTIQAGTTIQVSPGVDIIVANGGRLLAQGTSNAPIIFTRSGASGNWGNITINGAIGSPESRITYATFQFNVSDGGTPAIEVNVGAAFLDHLTFTTTGSPYIHVDGASFIISHCYFPTPTAGFELCHGTGGVRTDGHGLFLRNFFGKANGYNDVVDFTGSQRGNPIVHFIGNVVTGGDDDGWDLDGTDAWVEGNIMCHQHRNSGTPDSSSAVSGGDDSGNTSQITVIGNIIYDCDEACDAKQGNFYTFLNNTIVHQTHIGGIDPTGGVVLTYDTNFTAHTSTAEGAGVYLEGNVIYDIEALTRQVFAAIVTYTNNILPLAWSGPGGGNTITDPLFKHVPQLSETFFTNWAQAQVMWDWFSLQTNSPARGTGPNGRDKGAVIPIGASISGEPIGTTTNTSALLSVGINRTGNGIPTAGFPNGSGYIAYKWRLDGGPWSLETPINTPISLSKLTNGLHYVEVTGKRDSGLYQDDPLFGDDAVVTRSRTWDVENLIKITSANFVGANFTLHFTAAAGNTYTVQYKNALADPTWTKLADVPAQPVTGDYPVTDSSAGGQSRFYRIVSPAQ